MKKNLILLFTSTALLFVFLIFIIAQTPTAQDIEKYKSDPSNYLSKSPLDSGFISWFSGIEKGADMKETWDKISDKNLRKKLVNSLSVNTQVSLYNSVSINDEVIQAIDSKNLNSFMSNLIKKNSLSADKNLKLKGFENVKSIKTDQGGKIVIVKDSKGNEFQISVSTVTENFDLISLTDQGIQYDDHKNSNVLILSKGYIQKDVYVNGEPTGKIEVLGYTSKGMENPIIDFNSGKGQSVMIGIPSEGFKDGIHMWGDKINVVVGDFTFKPNPNGPGGKENGPWGFVKPVIPGVFNLRGDVSGPGFGLVIYDTDEGIFDSTGAYPDPAYKDKENIPIFRLKFDKIGNEIANSATLHFSGKNLEEYASFALDEGLSFTYKNIDQTSVMSTLKQVEDSSQGFVYYVVKSPEDAAQGVAEIDVPSQGTRSVSVNPKDEESPVVEQNVPVEESKTPISPDVEKAVGDAKEEIKKIEVESTDLGESFEELMSKFYINDKDEKDVVMADTTIPLPDENTVVSKTSNIWDTNWNNNPYFDQLKNKYASSAPLGGEYIAVIHETEGCPWCTVAANYAENSKIKYITVSGGSSGAYPYTEIFDSKGNSIHNWIGWEQSTFDKYK